ncbi:MAG: hypothetical protein D6776_08445, partial [Planctomycetota bacterium]
MKGSGGRGCERWQEALSASIDGELGGRERRALEAHLAECDACRARRARLSRVASLVGLLAPEGDEARAGARFVERLERRLAAEPPPERAASGRTRPLAVRRARWPAALRSLARIAAAVAIVVTAGWWAQVLYHRLRRPERARTPVVWRNVASEAQRPGRGPGHAPPRTGAASKLAAAPRTPQPPEIAGQPPEDEGGAGATDREAVAHANEPPPRDPAAAAVAEPEPAVAGADAAQRRSETARRERERARALARARRLARRIADRRGEEDERIAAVYELARLAPRLAPRHPEALRPLERILARPDAAGSTLWHETVRAVGTFPSRHTLPWLLAAAEHDPAACAQALARLHDPALQRWLAERGLAGLRGHETPLRVAVRALGRLRCRDAAEPIARLLETSRSARVRVACLAALRDLGSPVAQRAARRALEDPSAPVRVAAARLLARVPSSAASGPVAVRLAAERSAAVRIALAQALGACGGEPARAALERLRERDRSLSVRGAALLSLQRLDGVGLFAD